MKEPIDDGLKKKIHKLEKENLPTKKELDDENEELKKLEEKFEKKFKIKKKN